MKCEGWIVQHVTNKGQRKKKEKKKEKIWFPYHYSWWLLQCLMLAVCRTPVTRTQLNGLALYVTFSHTPVYRAPTWCLGSHGFDICQGLRFFLCPTLVTCWAIHLSHSMYIVSLHSGLVYQPLRFTSKRQLFLHEE